MKDLERSKTPKLLLIDLGKHFWHLAATESYLIVAAGKGACDPDRLGPGDFDSRGRRSAAQDLDACRSGARQPADPSDAALQFYRIAAAVHLSVGLLSLPHARRRGDGPDDDDPSDLAISDRDHPRRRAAGVRHSLEHFAEHQPADPGRRDLSVDLISTSARHASPGPRVRRPCRGVQNLAARAGASAS